MPIILVMSVRPSTRISATPIGRLFMNFDIGYFYWNLSRNSRFV